MSNIKIDRRQRHAGSRELAAVLAGALVLGFGTVATVASWQDSQLATPTSSVRRSNPEIAVHHQGLSGPGAVAEPIAP